MMLFLNLILLSILFFLYRQTEQISLREVESHARGLTKAIQLTIAEATGSDKIDISRLNEYLASLNIKGIKEISIVDNANKVVASTSPSNVGRILTEEEQRSVGEAESEKSAREGEPGAQEVRSILTEQAGGYNLILPVVARDIRFGYVLLSINREEFAKFLRGGYIRRLEAVVFVSIIGIVIAGILSRRYTRPIKKVAEAAMRVAGGDLDQKVAIKSRDEIGQLSESFNFMVERLKDSKLLEERLREAEHLAAVGQLSRNVAHEIRNPLNFINLSIAHLDEKFRPGEVEKQGQFDALVGGMRLEIERLNRLVNDFLDYSKPIKLNIQKTDVGHILDEAVNLVKAKAESEGVAIVKEYGAGQELNLDRDLFKTCVLNIFSNAFHAMEWAREKVLMIRAEKAGNEFVLSIKDTGAGVRDENILKVFDPFFTTRPGGLGLGLAITKRVIEDHGGSVEFKSSEGEGSETVVKLPVS